MWVIPIIAVWLFWASPVQAELYLWVDAGGTVHVVDEKESVPKNYRKDVKTYQDPKPSAEKPSESRRASLPEFEKGSQGAFAGTLARDLGLIRKAGEDPIRALKDAGIEPVGGWSADSPMAPEVYLEVAAAARKASDAGRISLSPDGAQAVVQQAAGPYLPSLEKETRVTVVLQEPEERGPEVIIIGDPEPRVVEVPVPYLVPYFVSGGHAGYFRQGDDPPRRHDGIQEHGIQEHDGKHRHGPGKHHRISGTFPQRIDGSDRGLIPDRLSDPYRVGTSLLSSSPVGYTNPDHVHARPKQ
jgi:hypothetical protein